MKVFVIGPSFVGKSTLVERLTGGKGVGVLNVLDERFKKLAELFRSRKATPLQITLVDSDALGKAYNENRPTRVFQELAEADAFLEVSGGLVGDFLSFTDTTLRFLSIESDVLSRRIERLKKEVAVGRGSERELEILMRALGALEDGTPLYSVGFGEEELKVLRGLGLLSVKPRVILFNATRESAPDEDSLNEVREQGLPYVVANLKEEDPNTLNRKVSEALLKATDTITFFTPGEKETRAWPLRRGGTVLEAAATIHNDLAKRFVRAEVVRWDRLLAAGGWKEAREKNYVRLEGKDYVVQDGDCIYIRAS